LRRRRGDGSGNGRAFAFACELTRDRQEEECGSVSRCGRGCSTRISTSTAIAGGIADDVRADYLACYEGDRFVESMRYVRRYPEELPALAGLLPRIAAPVTIVNGRHDSVVPLPNAEFLAERLPNSRLVIIDAGHFVWEEAATEYAAAILDSITAG
jgi:pimeloyl-ACP methyl ester carboxylesterase